MSGLDFLDGLTPEQEQRLAAIVADARSSLPVTVMVPESMRRRLRAWNHRRVADEQRAGYTPAFDVDDLGVALLAAAITGLEEDERDHGVAYDCVSGMPRTDGLG